MIAVDVNDHTEVYATGCRVLNKELGPDAARVFMRLSRGGTGDSVKEKYDRPDMTDDEFDAHMAMLKTEAAALRS
jgi:hypothetical protein